VGSTAFEFHRTKARAVRALEAAEAAARLAEASSAEAPPGALRLSKSYEQYLERIRTSYRSVLDLGPADWKAPENDLRFKTPGQFTFSAEDIPPPDPARLEAQKRQLALVRPMPYPYFQALSVLSDCCATFYRDVYYTHTLLSRQYGLDLPASFWPFTSGYQEGGAFAMFSGGGSDEPSACPIRIENDFVDTLPLFLTYYYRGWIDHAHSWSHETAPGYSLILPAEKELEADGEAALPLKPILGLPMSWQGFEVKMDLSKGIAAFELTLIDRNDLPHSIVYGVPLQGRQGWDVSRLARQDLGRFYLDLQQEANAKHLRAFGRPAANSVILKAATLRAKGTKGSTIALRSLRVFDLSRRMVERQMAAMRRYAILPIAATYHGGFTSWASFLDHEPCETKARVLGGESLAFSCARPALGVTPGTPSYMADLGRDFGLCFYLAEGFPGKTPLGGSSLSAKTFRDGTRYYEIPTRIVADNHDARAPMITARSAHGENLGPDVARLLAEPAEFGESRLLSIHFNLFNPEAFEPAAGGVLQMAEVKRLHPYTEAGLGALANAMYNLDGRRKFHERVWACPASVFLRYRQALRALAGHTRVEGDCVRITPWKDEVTGQLLPDRNYSSQDLHGQTFYVRDSARARVFVEDVELTALTRNPPDFSGRPSVTVVDTHAPTLVFDEIDFYEQNGRVLQDGASYYFQRRSAFRGDWCFEVQAERAGAGRILWKPIFLHSHETGFLRFAYKKTNPKTKVLVGFGPRGEAGFVASDGDLGGRQGWKLPHFQDTDYHDVVVDFAEMQAPADGSKVLPRDNVETFVFGLQGASPGDSIFFDRVELLAARGVRPDGGAGLVIGGRLTPHIDGQAVALEINGHSRTTVTRRGGWYLFTGVPRDAIAQITHDKQGVKYYPARGRLAQVCRNDLEYHIYAIDPRSPSIPRPSAFVGTEVAERELAPVAATSPEYAEKYAATHAPHSRRFYAGTGKRKLSYMVEDYVNNFGFIDKDRRVENPDKAIRILLQGECWTEGQQSTMNLHMNTFLESFLRRRTGVPVEVLVTATSSSTPASWSLIFEKYASRFDPQFVFLFVNNFNLSHLEPTLLKKVIGWDKEHAPYKMYDFDEKGNLREFAPDPNYGAFMTAPDPSPILGKVPILYSYGVLSIEPELVERSFQLLQAILAEQYLKRMRPKAAVLGLIVGYDQPHAPQYATRYPPFAVAYDQWLARIREVCDGLGIRMLDLSPRLFREDFSSVLLWEQDSHLTPAGNYQFAEALADQICALPEFQALVRKRVALEPTPTRRQ
jgi:hypothetical protein